MSDSDEAVLVEYEDAGTILSSGKVTSPPVEIKTTTTTAAAVPSQPPATTPNRPKPSSSGDSTPTLENEDAKKVTDDEAEAEDEASADDAPKKKKLTWSRQAPRALNIVSIGSEENAYAFAFHKERLDTILGRVPPGTKVAVVSVVGAFRTGKSFLLSWFLRYLYAADKSTDDAPWYQSISTLGTEDGFQWKAGSERNTTGIWMWSHPVVVQDGKLAVLLVDTQGMFDHETTMSLTASIFGFSTLLSSHLIYNVDKRIQEDNLQQLALFSEYAKTAVENDNADKDKDDAPKPFQRIEFLVRDWQHFDDIADDDDDDDEGEGEGPSNFEAMERMMDEYLEKIVSEREAKDLKDTRDQILGCFNEIKCYGLCHPGMTVTKRKFKGSVKDIEPRFLQLLDRFCKRVFSNMEPKKIHGHELTAMEFGAYVTAYADLFSTGAKFPEASTLLEATTSTNNNNAFTMAILAYQQEMDRIAGPNCSNFIQPSQLEDESRRHLQKSLEVFSNIANFGSRRNIMESREKLVQELQARYETYYKLNEGRDPLSGLEMWLIPALTAAVSAFLRWITDMTCSPYVSVCRSTSDLLSHAYSVVVIFMLIVAITKFKQIKDMVMRAKSAFDLLSAPVKEKKD